MRSFRGCKRALIAVVWLLAVYDSGLSCGLDWQVPVTHFEGVEEHGYVCISRQIGEVDFGNDLKLPLIINFRSDRNSSSPYLGKGWILALLDSNMVQYDEGTFLMTQPDGRLNLFRRDGKNTNLLNGSSGWKAEIKGGSITAWASCGWKIVFFEGRIASLTTPKNRKLEFIYSGNKATEIRELGTARLKVEFEPHTGEAVALVANDGRIEIQQAERPRVETMAGQNVVGGMDRSLNKFIGSPASTESFEFAVNDDIQPTLKVNGRMASERMIIWDPATKRMIKDGEWTYDITPHGALDPAAIGRTNSKNQTEFWYYDSQKGENIRRYGNREFVSKSFTSGKLNGRVRSLEQYENGKLIKYERAAYDENGNLLRIVRDDAVITYRDGKMASLTRAGKMIWGSEYDPSAKSYAYVRFSNTVEKQTNGNKTND